MQNAINIYMCIYSYMALL